MKVKIDAESDESRKRDLTLVWELHKVQAESLYQQLKEDAAYAKSYRDVHFRLGKITAYSRTQNRSSIV